MSYMLVYDEPNYYYISMVRGFADPMRYAAYMRCGHFCRNVVGPQCCECTPHLRHLWCSICRLST